MRDVRAWVEQRDYISPPPLAPCAELRGLQYDASSLGDDKSDRNNDLHGDGTISRPRRPASDYDDFSPRNDKRCYTSTLPPDTHTRSSRRKAPDTAEMEWFSGGDPILAESLSLILCKPEEDRQIRESENHGEQASQNENHLIVHQVNEDGECSIDSDFDSIVHEDALVPSSPR